MFKLNNFLIVLSLLTFSAFDAAFAGCFGGSCSIRSGKLSRPAKRQAASRKQVRKSLKKAVATIIIKKAKASKGKCYKGNCSR